MRKTSKILIVCIVLFVVCMLAFSAYINTQVNTIYSCKVIDIQQLQKITSTGKDQPINTSYTYIIVTDKETFVCNDNIFVGHFSKENIFYNIHKDSTYTFKVSGIGKTILTDYRNIIEIIK